ncbi:unnamed protein product [Mesocestoides corti]|uniref:Lipid-binding serum glycoprotein N-terminal domain-containing protein n=2 Tax=Mesocestoides corti TaxID=53468 RepID=A0A0R3ULP8_MESCO|nr:unnamed protein product [Mesocestoides corti]
MRLQQTFTMFFLVGLLPIFIHGFDLVPDHVVDSYLQSLSGQQFAFTVPHATNIGAVEITRIGSVRRACPTTKKAINENGIPLVEVGACLGVTDVAVSLPKLGFSMSANRSADAETYKSLLCDYLLLDLIWQVREHQVNMQVCAVFFLLCLLPIVIHSHRSHTGSVEEKSLESLHFGWMNSEIAKMVRLGHVRVLKLGDVTPACQTTVKKSSEGGVVTLDFTSCFRVTDAKIELPDRSVNATIDNATFVFALHVALANNTAPRLVIQLPVWRGVKVKGPFFSSLMPELVLKSSGIVEYILQSVVDSAIGKINWESLLD